jgi:hypothetical protein
MKEFLKNFIHGAFLEIFGIIVSTTITAIPVYYLWNWLVPIIFAIKIITFWQACGICLLIRILLPGATSPFHDLDPAMEYFRKAIKALNK